MLINESKLRQIIKSVINESMMDADMGSDRKIQALNLIKDGLSMLSQGKINLEVSPTIDTHIEDNRPYAYASFSIGDPRNNLYARVYNVYMFSRGLRVSYDTGTDEIDILKKGNVKAIDVIINGGHDMASEIYNAVMKPRPIDNAKSVEVRSGHKPYFDE